MDGEEPLDTGAGAEADRLAALEFGWGTAYRIGFDPERGYWARRRDMPGDRGEGDILAPDVSTLRDAIVGDYSLKPVPRDDHAAESWERS